MFKKQVETLLDNSTLELRTDNELNIIISLENYYKVYLKLEHDS